MADATATTAAAAVPDQPVLTPRTRAVARRALFWVGLGVVAIVIALLTLILRGTGAGAGEPLDPDSATPNGARAVVAVLRDHGIRVSHAETLGQARASVTAHDQSTLLIYDPNGYLSQQRLRQAAELAAETVLVDPDFQTLRSLAPGVHAAGSVAATKSLAAGCAVPAAKKAERISATGKAYRFTASAEAGENIGNTTAIGCFRGSNGAYSLVQLAAENGSETRTVLGVTDVLSNDAVIHDGNAALALNLLGSHPTLVWYTPSLADVAASGPPSLGALTPGWVTPTLILLCLVALAGAIWRGRRFGPLVVENLPVVVRAQETMEGRARLYQRSSARLRALDALRIGALGRIATRLALPRTASVAAIADAVAGRTGRDPAALLGILVDRVPRTDAELIDLSDALRDLEHDLQQRE